MWSYVLFVVVVYFLPNDHEPHVKTKGLATFPTAELCEIERKSISDDMALSYPGATDYSLYCEKHTAKDAKKLAPPFKPALETERLY